jgi:hypothetical protein
MLHAYFYTICLVFRYTSWNFYAFSGTNLLTRCHSASSLFSAVFVFHRKYSRNWTKQKPDIQKFTEASREPKRRWRGATGRPHHRAARPRAGPRPLVVKPPQREKPKYLITFPEYIVIRRRRRPKIGRVLISSWHLAGEGNHHRRSSSLPCLPPAR